MTCRFNNDYASAQERISQRPIKPIYLYICTYINECCIVYKNSPARLARVHRQVYNIRNIFFSAAFSSGSARARAQARKSGEELNIKMATRCDETSAVLSPIIVVIAGPLLQ